jgi:hypothetical protein
MAARRNSLHTSAELDAAYRAYLEEESAGIEESDIAPLPTEEALVVLR